MSSYTESNQQLLKLEKHLISYLSTCLSNNGNSDVAKPYKAQDLSRHLAPSVKKIWSLFNSRRPKNLPSYMGEPEQRLAYLASFFLPNIERTSHLLDRYAQPILQELTQTKAGQGQVFRILDIGAGPLSASLAFCMQLDRLAESPGKSKRRIPIEILAVERSPEIFEDGIALADHVIESLQLKGFEIIVNRISLRQYFKQQPTADLILATNVFNELKQGDKVRLAETLALPNQNPKLILFMEPGQDLHAQALSSFRDILLQSSKSYKILGPCPHQMSCPMGIESGRKDWCWFRLKVTLSPWMKALDRATGLRHDELSYSFIALSLGKNKLPRLWGRVVSDDINLSQAPDASRNRLFIHLRNQAVKSARGHEARMPLRKEDVTKGPLHKTLICHESGNLQGLFFKTKSVLQRGETLLEAPKNGYLAMERKSPKKENPERLSVHKSESSRLSAERKKADPKKPAPKKGRSAR